MRPVLIVLVLAAIPASVSAAPKAKPSQPASHFGLKCAGTQKTYASGGAESAWERDFSFDLGASKGWVVGAQAQFDIVATETRIAFWDNYQIDRGTGHLTSIDKDKTFPSITSAECQVAPFSPMPANKF